MARTSRDTKPLGAEKRAITSALVGLEQFKDRGWSGIAVSEASAMGISALSCGIRTISEQIGSLPLNIIRHQPDGGRQVDKQHRLARLLNRSPNPEMPRPVFFETLMSHCLLYGNAYCEIVSTVGGRPTELWPIHPTRCQVLRNTATRERVYQITEADGTQINLYSEDILHVPGLCYDGTVGSQLIQTARETIAFGLATQRHANTLYKNLALPSGVIQVPPGIEMDDVGRANLAKGFRAHSSLEGVGGVPVLEQGITFQPNAQSATNQQMQFVELQRFYVYEIARLLRIPPSKLQSLEKSSFASMTEQNREFLSCLNPWLIKWQCEIERKLFRDAELDYLYVEFDTDQLISADQNARYTANHTACGKAWKTVNEVRAEEGYASIGPDGDRLSDDPAPTPDADPYPAVNPLADALPAPEGTDQ